MIIEFSVSNFRSIKDEQTLSLVADDAKNESGGITPVENQPFSLLKSCVLYGANASGKTNVLLALRELATAITRSDNLEIGRAIPTTRLFFRLDKLCNSKPVSFKIEFICTDGVRYEYAVSMTGEDGVTYESLYSFPSGRRRLLFSREKGRQMEFGTHLKGNKKFVADSTLKNNLFLTKAAKSNIEQIVPVYMYFYNMFHFVFDRMELPLLYNVSKQIAEGDEGFKHKITNLLKAADTGICGLNIKIYEKDIDIKFDIAVPDVLVTAATDQVKYRPYAAHAVSSGLDAEPILFDMRDESNGTQEIYHLSGLLFNVLDKGGVLIVDEIERSLHPEITARLFSLFNNPKTNPKGAQLIATTHDVALLNQENFRRDQIWFTEKDGDGATSLYSMLEFKKSNVRKDAPWARWYLDGRFGATPVIDDELLESTLAEGK